MDKPYDLAIVGSGFGGSLLAMIARRLGLSVLLLEKGRHPRFAIGESTTPLANLLLEDLARRFDLPRLLPFCKWGSWQKAYPEIACGLKRGFTFYHHALGQPFAADPGRRDQLMVAASPQDGIADTHWYRPDFDHFLLREAQALGAGYLDQASLRAPAWEGGLARLTGERVGEPFAFGARFLIDATGPRGYLHGSLGLAENPTAFMPATQGLYAHFTGVGRAETLFPSAGVNPPYPADDAALHHVFDGGWIWVLRFNNGITSAGVAAVDALADRLRFAEGEAAWNRLLAMLPSVRDQFRGAEARTSFMHASRLGFSSGIVCGPGWALMPYAAGFVDPLLSTGFPLTLLGIGRLAEALACGIGTAAFEEKLREYETATRAEFLAAARQVAALYAAMGDFETFSPLSLLYFAAVTFSETARRLGQKPPPSFLLWDHPQFGPAARACLDAAMLRPRGQDAEDLRRRIGEVIAPFDVAGLGKAERRNWHPVDSEDFYRAAAKLGVGPEDIEALLLRCGFRADAKVAGRRRG